METCKVSVIVPVYNSEKYLRKCLNSLLTQTFKEEYEIILVDDGSRDQSGDICDEYAARDGRVRVIHKDNGGVSSARQLGLDLAKGEFVIHADPDDWVDSQMLECLYNKAIEDQAGMVICDFFVNVGEKQIYQKQEPSSLENDTILKELFYKLHGSCWNKLIKRTFFIDNNISFPKGINYQEDLIINERLLQTNVQVTYLPKAFYHYVIDVNTNSLVRTRSIIEEKNVIEIIKKEIPAYIFRVVYPYLCYNLSLHATKYLRCSQREFHDQTAKYSIIALRAHKRPLTIRLSLIFSSFFSASLVRKLGMKH